MDKRNIQASPYSSSVSLAIYDRPPTSAQHTAVQAASWTAVGTEDGERRVTGMFRHVCVTPAVTKIPPQDLERTYACKPKYLHAGRDDESMVSRNARSEYKYLRTRGSAKLQHADIVDRYRSPCPRRLGARYQSVKHTRRSVHWRQSD